jgi:hypothetical protein
MDTKKKTTNKFSPEIRERAFGWCWSTAAIMPRNRRRSPRSRRRSAARARRGEGVGIDAVHFASLEPIGSIPPAEAETCDYPQSDEPAMAA